MLSFARVKGNLLGRIPTELTVSLPANEIAVTYRAVENLPNANKFNIHVDRERLLECSALFPSFFIVTTVHVVCKRNLLVVAGR
jgi:hypothetical protein